MTGFKLSFYSFITDVIDEESPDAPRIIFSTRTGVAVTISHPVYEALTSGRFEEIAEATLRKLIDMELLVPAMENEFFEVLQQNKLVLRQGEVLGITMQPTANCQLGCHYCGQEHSQHNLSYHLYDKLFERINYNLDREKFRAIDVTWYGGEPLLGIKQIRDVSTRLQELARERGLDYGASMVTNGLILKPETFRELVTQYNIRGYQITIDGTEEFHDKRRITKGQGKTFKIIFNNVLRVANDPVFKEHNCSVNIRINIDRTNCESVSDFIQLLVDNNLQDKISLSFAAITDWGGNNASEVSLTNQEFAEMEIEWMVLALRSGFKFRNVLPKRSHSVCMVVDEFAEVYDAFGNIYPCWEFPYTGSYTDPKYLIGNLKLPYETYNPDAVTRHWNEDVAKDGVSWCKKCNFFPVCGGGCPKMWYEGTPACPSFKFNMEDRLIFQYLLNKTEDLSQVL